MFQNVKNWMIVSVGHIIFLFLLCKWPTFCFSIQHFQCSTHTCQLVSWSKICFDSFLEVKRNCFNLLFLILNYLNLSIFCQVISHALQQGGMIGEHPKYTIIIIWMCCSLSPRAVQTFGSKGLSIHSDSINEPTTILLISLCSLQDDGGMFFWHYLCEKESSQCLLLYTQIIFFYCRSNEIWFKCQQSHPFFKFM